VAIDPAKGEMRSMGWVNIRDVLDSDLKMDKVLFNNVIAMGLRVDHISINPRMFRAMLAKEVKKASHGRESRLTDEQRLAVEEQVRLEMLRNQPPSMGVYEMAWKLESGHVFFGAIGNKINIEFSEWFTETFSISLEPQFPFLRAERWAKQQHAERELREVLPSPFSPEAPVEVIEVGSDEEGNSKAERNR